MKSQKENILEHLQAGKSINPIEALELYGCFRLAAVINTLRKQHPIKDRPGTSKKGRPYAIYYLLPERRAENKREPNEYERQTRGY